MTALEKQKVQFQALTYEYIERAEAIQIGSWLEFKDKNSGTLIRCKLASKLEESDTYIFVNRLGFKVIESTCGAPPGSLLVCRFFCVAALL